MPPVQIELGKYFRSLKKVPTGVRSLADLIAFNEAHPSFEEPAGYEDNSMWAN